MDIDRGRHEELSHFDVDALVECLAEGRQDAADAIVRAWLERGSRYEDIAVRGIQAALYRIGELWAEGRASVAQEHLATAMAQRLLVRALDAAPFAAPRDDRVVIACVQGNHHALGARMIADAFLIAGWNVEYLGADVPTADLVAQVVSWRPDLVGLSVSLPEQVAVAVDAIAQIEAALGEGAPRFVLGGRPLEALPELREGLSADVWTDGVTGAVGKL